MPKVILTICLLLLSLSSGASAIDDEFNKVIKKYSIENGPGFAVGVYKNNKPVFIGSSGLANIEFGIPVNKDYIFRIASLTKQFTAVAILKLAEENKLQLDDDIHKYLKDYPAESHKITISHLLSHTSGLNDYLNVPGRMESKFNEPATHEEVMNEIKNDPTLFAPGEATAYSNTGYYILGRIIENVSGKTYAQYLTDNFFKPLGMKNSGSETMTVINNQVSGYDKDNGNWIHSKPIDMNWVYSAGELVSTIDDMARWFFALSSGEIISPEYFQKMITPDVLNNGEQAGNVLQKFGFGVMRSDLLGISMAGHTGNINGFNTYAEYSVKNKSYVVALVNTGQENIDSVGLARELSAIQNKLPIPDFKAVQQSANQLSKHTGVYDRFGGSIEIVVEDNGLKVMQEKQQILLLKPMADGRYFVEGSLTVYAFNEDKSGIYLDEYMYLSSSPFRHKKIK